MSKFSELLYELRKEKNLTQSELAEKLGITNKAVSKWETGEAMPDTAQLLPLADILGVSVDELLRGERTAANSGRVKENAETEEEEDEDGGSIRFSSGRKSVKISSKGIFVNSPEAAKRMEEDSWQFANDTDSVEVSPRGVYINGKRAERCCGFMKSVPERVAACVCASLFALSLLAYVLTGWLTGLWHPMWCIVTSGVFGCGIAGCICDMCDRGKVARKKKKGENPYTGGACGIIMCASLLVFLCVSAILNLWNIMWILPVAGICACIIVGTVGGVFTEKSEKKEK